MNEPDLHHNQPEFSVSELSHALKRAVENAFGQVRIRGEISGFKRAASGHLYFNLKDENAVLNAVCWRGVSDKLAFIPEDGLEVVATGKITTYPGRSNYQIVVEFMEPAGAGALMALLEKRRAQLQQEGLFDPARKQPLPFMPKVVGVVSSPTGAVIQDILHRLSDRFPVHVLLWPVKVQGEGAAEEISSAIEGFNQLPLGGDIPRPDILIVARGGGSLEDLWAFNEEIVVRAAAASALPLISAVGHETDTTLIDYVSDKRAPTPTAAAEMAVPVRQELLAYVYDTQKRLLSAVQRSVEEKQQFLVALSRGLISPKQWLDTMTQRLDDWSERLQASYPALLQRKSVELQRRADRLRPQLVKQLLDRQSHQLDSLGKLLESYHYKKVLARGYAIVRSSSGEVVTQSKQLHPGDDMSVEWQDGKVAAVVSGAKPVKKSAKKALVSTEKQTSLFDT